MPSETPVVLITGASRGIGLELSRQYAIDGWQVLATCRQPRAAGALQALCRSAGPRMRLFGLDVAEHEQIERLGAVLKGQNIDLMINNAAWAARQSTLAEVDYACWERAMRINAYATLKMAQVFRQQIAHSRKKTIITISSQMGSTEVNIDGGNYAYRASKAAVNMIVRSLAAELSAQGITVVSVHPGWVRTELGGPRAPLAVEEAVSRLRRTIEQLRPADSGRFIAYDGADIRG